MYEYIITILFFSKESSLINIHDSIRNLLPENSEILINDTLSKRVMFCFLKLGNPTEVFILKDEIVSCLSQSIEIQIISVKQIGFSSKEELEIFIKKMHERKLVVKGILEVNRAIQRNKIENVFIANDLDVIYKDWIDKVIDVGEVSLVETELSKRELGKLLSLPSVGVLAILRDRKKIRI